MDTNKMREQFEAWAKDQGYFNLRRDIDGRYKFQTAWAAWEGWQASRGAVVVELPEPITDLRYHGEFRRGQVSMHDVIRAGIEAQGLKVAP